MNRFGFVTMIGWMGCNSQALTLEELQDPESCVDCHPDHHRQWSGSMHAYAAEDPIFLAMNAQGQAETNGELGDFCIKCHAPLAVELGLTTDGLNLDEIPDHLLGITCYYCHQVDAVEGTHNNPLQIAMDTTLRGPYRDPVPSKAHDSAYSPLHDREVLESADLCGSCHDIVTPLGGHIERTYAEWQESLFANLPVGRLTCSNCHMEGTDGVAAEAEGVPLRRIHDHSWPGVDLAVTPFPQADVQRDLVQELLDDTVGATLCVMPPTGTSTLAVVSLENVASGHSFPSGATADRRVWVEIEAFEAGQSIWSSGVVPPGEPLAGRDETDPDLWRLHSTLLDVNGDPTHKFWEAADIESDDLLVAQTTIDPTSPDFVQTHRNRNYIVRNGVPDRIRMEIKVRPVALDLIDDLIAEGYLDAAIRAEMPEFSLTPTILEWTPEVPVNSGDLACVPQPPPAAAGVGGTAR